MDYPQELNFVFRFPTKIVFGPGTAKEAEMEVDELKKSRALIVTDRDLAQTDLVRRVQKALGKRCVGIFSDVVPDTGLQIVNAGAECGRQLEADILVSVGGEVSSIRRREWPSVWRKAESWRTMPVLTSSLAPSHPMS